MQMTNNVTRHCHEAYQGASEPQQFAPLESVTSPTVGTAACAHYMNRRPQTMRGWACYEDGPIRPIRVNGRLAWPVADIKRVMGVR